MKRPKDGMKVYYARDNGEHEELLVTIEALVEACLTPDNLPLLEFAIRLGKKALNKHKPSNHEHP